MACREAVEAVTEYLEGAMAPRDRASFERHLGACDHCTAYVEQIRATIELTGQIRPEDLSPEACDAILTVFRSWAAESV
jgi:anti-sigma factor RsiW